MFADSASPYFARYVVQQHAEDNRDNYPLAVAIILLQMYMDGIMTSLKTDDEAIKSRDQLRELLGKAGFEIRRWCGNMPKVLRDVPVEDRVANGNTEESKLPCMKALRVQWNAEMDMTVYLQLEHPAGCCLYQAKVFKETSYVVWPIADGSTICS